MYRVDTTDGLWSRIYDNDSLDSAGFDQQQAISVSSGSDASSQISSCNLSLCIVDDDYDNVHVSTRRFDESVIVHNVRGLCDDMRTILDMPSVCDVTFLVGEDKVPVYGIKAIMAARSRKFLSLFQSHQANLDDQSVRGKKTSRGRRIFSRGSRKKCADLVIPLPYFTPATFRAVLTFIHYGTAKMTIDNVFGLMTTADAFDLPDLREACTDFALSCINVDRVMSLLQAAQLYPLNPNISGIIDKIWRFISEHAERILRSPQFASLDRITASLVLGKCDLRASDRTLSQARLRWINRGQKGFQGETTIRKSRWNTVTLKWIKKNIFRLKDATGK